MTWFFLEHWLLAHTAFGVWIVTGGVMFTAAVKFLPRLVLEFVAATTRDQRRQLVCLEMIRMRRPDAALFPSYLSEGQQQPVEPPPELPVKPKPRLRELLGHRD